jgi:hypothetical protein
MYMMMPVWVRDFHLGCQTIGESFVDFIRRQILHSLIKNDIATPLSITIPVLGSRGKSDGDRHGEKSDQSFFY